MAPYSMDLRERVVRAWDTSGDAEEVAATFGVSRAWDHRLVQRRRETGSMAPRQQTKFRLRVLAGQEERLAALIAARPDCDVGRTTGGVAHDGGHEHAVAGHRSTGPDRKKNRIRRRTTPARRRR
jgi:transposase